MSANLHPFVQFLYIVFFLISSNCILAQDCDNPTFFSTECGTIFELCNDNAVTEVNVPVIITITSNDNLGILDPCDVSISSPPSNGTAVILGQDQNCAIEYTPNTDYIGPDEFKYTFIYRDECTIVDPFCEEGVYIWVLNSIYYGPDNVSLDVYAGFNLFATIAELNNGDEFTIDGSSLDPSENTEWTFKFYDNECLGNREHCKVIDFAELQTGEEVTNQYITEGVTVSALNLGGGPSKAIIFDSSNPSGGDIDLGTPNQDFGGPGIGVGGEAGTPGENNVSLGNVIILAEDDVDSNNDGLVDDPDDEAGGGFLIFTFDEPVHVESMSILDLEEDASNMIHVYDPSGTEIGTYPLQGFGDNSYQNQAINLDNVIKMEVEFESSGAVDDIAFCRKKDCETKEVVVETTCPGAESVINTQYGDYFRPFSACVGSNPIDCQDPIGGNSTIIDITQTAEAMVNILIGPPGPLPIEFGSISGRTQGESNVISWSILSVEGEKELRLERSADGKSFETLVSFKDLEAGNFNTLDDNPISELTYYRFTSISFNGELTITHSIAIENKQLSEGVNIYPIPATEEININANKVIYKVDLFNLAGKRIIAVNPQEREARIIIDSDIQAGIYFIRTTLEDGSMKTKRIHILR